MSTTVEVLKITESPTRAAQESLLRETLRHLLHNHSAVAGLVIIGFYVVIAIFAGQIATYDPIQSMIGQPGETGQLSRKPPCLIVFGCTGPQHIMGLDLNARDLYSRIIYASRTSLTVGISATLIAVLSGTLVGLIAGYAGGWIDNVIMRILDVVLAFPSLLLAITIVTIRGPGLENALLAIGLVSIPIYARLIRSNVLGTKENEYVTAVRSIGASPLRILFLHIFPNTWTPVMVQATLGIGTAVLDAAALSFLGLGAQPPTPEWGQMLSEGRSYVFTAPHLVFYPGIAIMLTVLGFNLLGDGLRDVLDPRLNRI